MKTIGTFTLCSAMALASQTLFAADVVDTAVNPANGNTYHLLSADAWQNANAHAFLLGGTLATINDEAEQTWVQGLWGDQGPLWIGLTDMFNEGTFQWVSGEPVTYTNWAAGRPDSTNPGDDFVHMASDSGEWIDANGGGSYLSVVEIEGDDTGGNTPPVCDAGGPYTVECEGNPTGVTLDGSASSDPDQDVLTFNWTGPFEEGEAEGEITTVYFPGVGTYEVMLEVSDGIATSACSTLVTIQDTTPPSISVILTPSVLWPPNHKMVAIAAEVEVEDGCDAEPVVRLVDIVSNEPQNGRGDGNTQPDVMGADLGTADTDFALRAERSGNGRGRIYTVTYETEDASGNVSVVDAFVVVPKSQGDHGFPCVPDVCIPVAPCMEEDTASSAFTWKAQPCATWYQVWVNRNGKKWHSEWIHTGHAAGLVCETVGDLPFGKYHWWVRSWSPGGSGRWSQCMSFSVGAAVPVAPAGPVNEVSPDLCWDNSDSTDATWFYLYVNRADHLFWRGWVRASETQGAGDYLCYGLPVTFPAGPYRWWVKTWSPDGQGPWSDGLDFSVSP